MRTITKLGAVAFLAGAAIVPALNANAVQHTADFTLQAPPVLAAVASTTNTVFGVVTIPGDGEDATTKTPDTTGVVTISNAVDGASYTVTVGNATCPTGVTLAPSADYDGTTTVVGGNSGAITFASATTTLSMGGTLSVASDATAGAGTCTYDVTIAAAGG